MLPFCPFCKHIKYILNGILYWYRIVSMFIIVTFVTISYEPPYPHPYTIKRTQTKHTTSNQFNIYFYMYIFIRLFESQFIQSSFIDMYVSNPKNPIIVQIEASTLPILQFSFPFSRYPIEIIYKMELTNICKQKGSSLSYPLFSILLLCIYWNK